jgi:hypothetical protein
MDICIDFDGTCVTHEFPKIGKDIGAVPILKKIVASGHQLILWTMRSNTLPVLYTENGECKEYCNCLTEAVDWFANNGIELYGVNVNPTQTKWTDSPKIYGHLYIDDAALGCPLILDAKLSNRPFVDWKRVKQLLMHRGVFN